MSPVTIDQIDERLKALPSDKLLVVYEFVSLLADHENKKASRVEQEPLQTMFASESVLQRDWNRPEEDAAWANL